MVFYDPQFCFLLEFMINDKALITEKKKKKESDLDVDRYDRKK